MNTILKGIAEQVVSDYKMNGRIAVPDGIKAVAFSSRMSSDDADKRRLLHLVFEDRSELSIDTRLSIEKLSVSFSDSGYSDYSLSTNRQALSPVRSVLEEVVQERSRQDEKWGGQKHDIAHSSNDWIAYITKHAGKAIDAESFREQMVKVAALAVAAIEAVDARKAS